MEKIILEGAMQFIDEIKNQPTVLKGIAECYSRPDATQKLRNFLQNSEFRQVIFTGMGSSLFASYIPCHYLRGKGIRAFAFEANELASYEYPIIDNNTLVVLVSQSGESKEVLDVASKLPEGVHIVTVTNNVGSSLYQYGEAKIEIQAGPEETTANKTYTNTIAALVNLAYFITGDEQASGLLSKRLMVCAEMMENILEHRQDEVSKLGDLLVPCKYLAVIGSGASYATVSQAEIIMEEAAKTWASRYTVGQFLHGPNELIDNNYCILLLDMDPKQYSATDRVIETVTRYGGKSVVFSNRYHEPLPDKRIVFRIDYDEPLTAPIIEIFPIELVVNDIGLKRGLKPGILTRVQK